MIMIMMASSNFKDFTKSFHKNQEKKPPEVFCEKKVLLKNSQCSPENTYVDGSATLSKKDSNTGIFL